MSPRNEIIGIVYGILLLLGMHFLAGIIIFGVGLLVFEITHSPYIYLTIWAGSAVGLFLLQLLYVIPLILWLRRRQYLGMMKGVIIGAVITALLNGGCFLLLQR
ncbi:MAG: hypothetical protein H0X31_21330 [Nostocaceae cyanobacterium]|nr:hypothetical protein [Nostocaceae cyanobacterium]